MRTLLEDAGIRVVRTPAQAPNANAHAERLVRSITTDCLNRIVPLDERHFRGALREFIAHYPPRAESPGPRQRTDHGPLGTTSRRSDSSPSPSRRPAQLLRERGVMRAKRHVIQSAEFSDGTGPEDSREPEPGSGPRSGGTNVCRARSDASVSGW